MPVMFSKISESDVHLDQIHAAAGRIDRQALLEILQAQIFQGDLLGPGRQDKPCHPSVGIGAA